MSLIHIDFRSPVLNKDVAMNVIVPDAAPPPWPVFYLLHGLSDDYSKWHRNTSIERYAAEYPFLIVMPDGFRGCYTNNEAGPAYFDYLIQDVLGQVERLFHVRTDRAGRCVGGLSMGGYGAMLLALRRPELFNSATSHSGALLLGRRPASEYEGSLGPAEYARIFGPEPRGSDHDLLTLTQRAVDANSSLPHLRLDCGRDDFIFDHSQTFHAHLDELGVAHEYQVFDGAHNWAYWDEHIQEALAFHARWEVASREACVASSVPALATRDS